MTVGIRRGRRACLRAGAAIALGAGAIPARAALPVVEQARRAIVAEGERALEAGDAQAAAEAFNRAGRMAHEADAELGLLRAMMQAGDYRRALAFAAHVAGVHPDVGTGPALYAWLLHAGGQVDAARATADAALARLPDDATLRDVRALLDAPSPAPTAALRASPARFGPESPSSRRMPARARPVASGLLLPDGGTVITAAAAVDPARRGWVRDGLGRVADVTGRADAPGPFGVVLLRLDAALPAADASTLALAARDPFAGSPAFAVGFPAGVDAGAMWPLMRIGFLGATRSTDGAAALGLEIPDSLRGGPVFDATGALVGLAVPGASGSRLLPPSALRAAAADVGTVAGARPRVTPDAIYEQSMPRVVQVLVDG